MAPTLEQVVNSSFPDQAAFIQAATSALEHSSSTTGTPTAKSMAQPQAQRGVAKTKKKNTPAKSGKEKATRSVNSFMMFRCYYAIIFEAFQQKVISSYIVYLWQSDPFKAKWALLAKAYSVIRDHVGKEHAPVDAFLSIVADFVGIIDNQNYLIAMGWEVCVNEAGIVSLAKSDMVDIDIGMLSTNLSAEDIIAYASANGYTGTGLINKGPVSQPSMAMAASAQSLSLKTSHAGLNLSPLAHEKNRFSSGTTLSGPPDVAFQRSGQELDLVYFAAAHARAVEAMNHKASGNAQMARPAPSSNTRRRPGPSAVRNPSEWDPNLNTPGYSPFDHEVFDAFNMSEWIHPNAYLA
uniref:Mating-type protein MAT1-1-1 n=1 Tax=Polycauliona polycarpa TaxID=1301501 RepID=Q4GZM3_9LECA|nr:mating-type protein MAT1-1-1 [Xanthoria polycarpa]